MGDDFTGIEIRGLYWGKRGIDVERGLYNDFTLTLQDIRAYGFVVITKGVEQFTRKGQKVSARFIRLWVRRSAAWQCVGEHLTPRSLPPL
jgi:hypothetical protein